MPSSPFPPLFVGFGLLFIVIPLIGIVAMVGLIALAVVANRRRGQRIARPPVTPTPLGPEQPYPPEWYLAMLNDQQQGQQNQPLTPPAHPDHAQPQHHHQPPMHTLAANPAMHTPMHSTPPAPPPVGHH